MKSLILGNVDLRMAYAIWMRNVTAYAHTWKINLLPNFFEPILYLIGMGLGLGAYLERGMEGQDYIAFIAPGLMAAAAMNGASFETTYNMFVRMTLFLISITSGADDHRSQTTHRSTPQKTHRTSCLTCRPALSPWQLVRS